MKYTLLAAILAAVMMTACGKPNQALPEQEKDNFAKITSGAPAESAEPAAPSAGDDADKE